jgi:tryptophanyl-tRNA synthetase
MTRMLSGVQPSGQLHIGNYAGAIKQFVDFQNDHELFVFVASYHALTSLRDAAELRANTRQVVIDYLAFGLDPARCHIYLQQDLPEVTELSWILSCLCPMHLMDKGVSYKDKVAKGLASNVGLYSYPILQAADILIVDPDVVPVGKDQIQHIEICRDLASKINHHYGEAVLKEPAYRVREDAALVPGTDGEKMSKSYGNTIDPFLPEPQLRKLIMRIKTGLTPMEEPLPTEGCTIHQIFSALAGAGSPRVAELTANYARSDFGYGHAKQALFELILGEFAEARRKREELMRDEAYLARVLAEGAAAARDAATPVMQRVRRAVGLR